MNEQDRIDKCNKIADHIAALAREYYRTMKMYEVQGYEIYVDVIDSTTMGGPPDCVVRVDVQFTKIKSTVSR